MSDPPPETSTGFEALEGHRFPGGSRAVEHWENFLLTDCTNRDALADDLCHPIAAFNMSVLGAGTSITGLFEILDVADAGAVWLEELDLQYERQLAEGTSYRLTGGIDTVERAATASGRPYDRVIFSVDLEEPDGDLAARVITTWRIRR